MAWVGRKMRNGFVYILECADGSYYVGSHRGTDLQDRVNDHNQGVFPKSYTHRRRPVKLLWNEWFESFEDMIACERQIKGWSRLKKEALIRGDYSDLPQLSKTGFKPSEVKK
jgi:putative endonuclease